MNRKRRERKAMIHGETYLLCNMGLCACAYPLGGRLAGLPLPRPSRWMLAAALGGASAGCALFLPSPLWLMLLPAGVVLCFGRFGWQACLRCLITTLGAALLCGGALNVLLRSAPPGAAWAATAALCLLLYWLAALAPSSMTAVRQVELTVGEHSVLLPAMVDTGNLLRDPITGLPVMVVPFRAVRVLVPEIARWVQRQELPPRMRLISVRTAAGSSLLPVFRPDSCRLYLNGRSCDADVVVAVTGQEYGGIQALVPMAALPEGGMLPAGMEE